MTHEQDLKQGYAGVFIPARLETKHPNAPKKLIWQWFFPAKELTFGPETGEYRRYHLNETHVKKAIKRAVNASKILKRASAHTFRHSFPSHLPAANQHIRSIQELLGHSSVRTTISAAPGSVFYRQPDHHLPTGFFCPGWRVPGRFGRGQ